MKLKRFSILGRAPRLAIAAALALVACDSPSTAPDRPVQQQFAVQGGDGILLLDWAVGDETHEVFLVYDTLVLDPDGTGRRSGRLEERVMPGGGVAVTPVEMTFSHARDGARVLLTWAIECEGGCAPVTTEYRVEGDALVLAVATVAGGELRYERVATAGAPTPYPTYP